MKNPIIAELRRIRDAHAAAYQFDLDAIGRDLMDLEPWMQKNAYILRGWQNGPHGFAEPEAAKRSSRTAAKPKQK